MKIIFLDHDGPMVLRQSMEIPEIITNFNQAFSIDTVNALNEIIKCTDAEIVISSDWRLYFSLDKLKEMYRDIGALKTPISVTPNLWNKLSNVNNLEEVRSQEIMKWLNNNNKTNDITHWVAIDDLTLSISDENFVQTDRGILGISDLKIKRDIIEILMK